MANDTCVYIIKWKHHLSEHFDCVKDAIIQTRFVALSKSRLCQLTYYHSIQPVKNSTTSTTSVDKTYYLFRKADLLSSSTSRISLSKIIILYANDLKVLSKSESTIKKKEVLSKFYWLITFEIWTFSFYHTRKPAPVRTMAGDTVTSQDELQNLRLSNGCVHQVYWGHLAIRKGVKKSLSGYEKTWHVWIVAIERFVWTIGASHSNCWHTLQIDKTMF